MDTQHAALVTEQTMGEFALCLTLLRYITSQLEDVEAQLQRDGRFPEEHTDRGGAAIQWALPPSSFDVSASLYVN